MPTINPWAWDLPTIRLGTHCFISSKAHNVSESSPPANCPTKSTVYLDHVTKSIDQIENIKTERTDTHIYMVHYKCVSYVTWQRENVIEYRIVAPQGLENLWFKGTYSSQNVTWWVMYGKWIPWSNRDSWLDSLSELRTESSSVFTLFMYILARFIEACFICKGFKMEIICCMKMIVPVRGEIFYVFQVMYLTHDTGV